jgi:hypothetical protein
VTGDVRARGVDDQLEVDGGQVLLDELLAELALHERVGGDLPAVPAVAAELEEPLAERRRQRVLACGRHVHLPVDLALGRILLGDVRRVADDGGVAAEQHLAGLGVVLEGEGLTDPGLAGAGGGGLLPQLGLGVLRVHAQRVGDDDVERQGRRVGQRAVAGLGQDLEGQAEAGDGDRVGVEVGAVHRVDGLDRGDPGIDAGLAPQAVLEQPGEGPEERSGRCRRSDR